MKMAQNILDELIVSLRPLITEDGDMDKRSSESSNTLSPSAGLIALASALCADGLVVKFFSRNGVWSDCDRALAPLEAIEVPGLGMVDVYGNVGWRSIAKQQRGEIDRIWRWIDDSPKHLQLAELRGFASIDSPVFANVFGTLLAASSAFRLSEATNQAGSPPLQSPRL